MVLGSRPLNYFLEQVWEADKEFSQELALAISTAGQAQGSKQVNTVGVLSAFVVGNKSLMHQVSLLS
jgi:hypothetical protein